jgi:chitin synthase
MGPGGLPAITAHWATKDVRRNERNWEQHILTFLQIIYVSIIGFVMLAAFLEWFLWLAAFLYCLVKVYQKAENWTVKVLAVLMMFVFTALRYVHHSGSTI